MTYRAWQFEVEFAPGFHPKDPPGDGDWVSLGTPFAYTITRGRQDDLDEFQAGSMVVTLDNADEDLDQLLASSVLYADALPNTPMRLIATLGIESRTLFTGYTLDGFSPQGLRGGGTVDVTVVDWLGWAASVEMPDSQWAAWCTAIGPDVWIRGYSPTVSLGHNDTGGTVPAFNMASVLNGAGGDMYGDPTYPQFVERSESGIVTGAATPKFFLGSFGAFGGLIMDAGDSLAQTGQWLAAGWFQTPDVQSMTWGGSTWTVSLDASGYLVATINVGGTPETATISVDHTDDTPHVWFLKVTSTGGSRSMKLYSDLGTNTNLFGAAAVSGGGILNFRGIGLVNAEAGDFVYFSGSNLASVFAITNEDGLPPAAWVGPSENPILWSGETITERVTHTAAAAAVPPPTSEVVLEAAHTLYQYDPGSTLAADIALLGSSYLGAAYMLRDGTLRVRDYTFTAGDDRSFDILSAVVTDDGADPDWVYSVSDNFTRANSSTTIGGNWRYEGNPLGAGRTGIISNQAYIPAAATDLPVGAFQQMHTDAAIGCDFVSAVLGQGLIVRRTDWQEGIGSYIAVEVAATNVQVNGYTDGVLTDSYGDTGSDTITTDRLFVTTEGDQITVQIGTGTVYTFTITNPVHMIGDGVGVIYTRLSVTPASSARWDTFSGGATRDTMRPSNRSRTGTRADRIVNTVSVTLPASDIYYHDPASQARYGIRRKSFNSYADDKTTLAGYVEDLIAAKKDPVVEIGELTFEPWGNQSMSDWLVRDVELERKVTYREALYRAGTEVVDSDFRISSERWDWSQAGTAWTVTLKLVPA